MNINLILDANHIVYFWLIVSIIFLFLELGTPGLFFFVAFALGSACASIFAYLGFSFTIQCLSALFFSIISFFLLKYFFINKDKKIVKSNVDALIGQQALVTEIIKPNKPGLVKVGSETWTALSDDDSVLLIGTIARVVSVKGNRVVVSLK